MGGRGSKSTAKRIQDARPLEVGESARFEGSDGRSAVIHRKDNVNSPSVDWYEVMFFDPNGVMTSRSRGTGKSAFKEAKEKVDRFLEKPSQQRRRAIQQNAVNISTRQYGLANGGRGPRGRGQWLFTGRTGGLGEQSSGEFSFNGSYSEAKKEARKWAASNGFALVEVES